MIRAADLGGSLAHFGNAVQTFFDALADIGWGYLIAGLLLTLAMQLARGHAWANALRAAYPGERIRESRIIASFLAGVGLNGILPAHGGDAVKIVLAKRSVERSSYATVISSFGVLSPFDTGIGLLVLAYAITQGLLPKPPDLSSLPAFDISFWAAHPRVLIIVVLSIMLGGVILFTVYARRVEAFWGRVRQGFGILAQPRRYAREVAAWQLFGWLCRFASFWLFLEAFHVPASIQTVLLVMSVQAITNALPFTPGGAGAQQALLVATLSGASHTAVLAYSVGQQIAVTAWSIAIGFLALAIVFRITDWRRLVHEGKLARASASGS